MPDEPTPTPTPAPEPPPDPTPDPTPDPEPTPEPLGDAGKKALEAERARANAAEKDLKAAKAALDKATKDAMSEQDRKVAEARDEGRTEAVTEANEKILTAEVKAAASGFANPADALLFIDRDGLVNDAGDVDEAAITERLATVLTERPYLAKPTGGTPAPKVPQGQQGATGVNDLDDRIAAAKAAGNNVLAIQLETQKLPGSPGATP